MTLRCGIVGLPNVGKSTFFNALTNTVQAQAANYPFCTIEPNIAIVPVPDQRLNNLADLAKSINTVPNFIEMVDIAGLVRGASDGEGLGNKFLENIRNVDAIIHVVRCFEDDNILHTEQSVNPIRDVQTIELELLISDIKYLEKMQENLNKTAQKKPDAQQYKQLVSAMLEFAAEGKMLHTFPFQDSDISTVSKWHLLTNKKTLYVANMAESQPHNSHLQKLTEFLENREAGNREAGIIPVCIKMEGDMIQFSPEEKHSFLQDAGFQQTALERAIQESYRALDLLTFFTVGEKESRAWSIKNGSLAPNAAGVIHSDFERGFIKAETISYDDFIAFGGYSGAKENGKIRMEGKEYLIKEGDIFNFKFNV